MIRPDTGRCSSSDWEITTPWAGTEAERKGHRNEQGRRNSLRCVAEGLFPAAFKGNTVNPPTALLNGKRPLCLVTCYAGADRLRLGGRDRLQQDGLTGSGRRLHRHSGDHNRFGLNGGFPAEDALCFVGGRGFPCNRAGHSRWRRRILPSFGVLKSQPELATTSNAKHRLQKTAATRHEKERIANERESLQQLPISKAIQAAGREIRQKKNVCD